jgi:hypothetical protein
MNHYQAYKILESIGISENSTLFELKKTCWKKIGEKTTKPKSREERKARAEDKDNLLEAYDVMLDRAPKEDGLCSKAVFEAYKNNSKEWQEKYHKNYHFYYENLPGSNKDLMVVGSFVLTLSMAIALLLISTNYNYSIICEQATKATWVLDSLLAGGSALITGISTFNYIKYKKAYESNRKHIQDKQNHK